MEEKGKDLNFRRDTEAHNVFVVEQPLTPSASASGGWLSDLATQAFESACLAIDDIETLSYHGQGRKVHENPNPRNITEKGSDKCRRMGK